MSSSQDPAWPTRYRKKQAFRTDYAAASVTQYESTETGLTIVIVDQQGPIVHGSFALATEIHDDSGAPHTLEHLCFMGSRNYDHVGFLDKLGAKAYSETNAWTSTDHTEYVLDSAGWEAFSQILPIYLDHIIAPTLNNASCYTEVHHVDGEGHDAGVVYSEMQASENNADMLMFAKAKQLLYPEEIGFRYDTFGVTESLRKLTADRIREYHREIYQPRNLCVIIIGEVNHADVLSVLDKFEETILDIVPKPGAPFRRPWIDSAQVSPLQKSTMDVVGFPEEDESTGQITMNFFGPPYVDHLSCSAVMVLLAYLAGSSASILENTLVEKEQLASSVLYDYDIQPTTVINFSLSSVATEELETVEARFFELLRETADMSIDMKYMQDCISREKRQRQSSAENSSSYFSESIVTDFLFGERNGVTLKAELENLSHFDQLGTWSEPAWRHLLKTWFLEHHHVTILGKPSSALSEKLKSEERDRIDSRKETLGKIGLDQLEKRLASAKAENAKEIPQARLSEWQIPSTESIHFINTTTARGGIARKANVPGNHLQTIIDRDSDTPVFLHFEHIDSNFVHLVIVIGTEVIPVEQRPLLAVYMANFFTAPMLRDSEVVGFEQILMELEGDTVNFDIGLGSKLGNSEVLTIRLEVEIQKYAVAIRWIKDLLSRSVFDPERIKAATTKLLADIPDEKRDGSDMASQISLMVCTAPSSAVRACSTLVKSSYLKIFKQILRQDPDRMIKQLKELNSLICTPSNFRIFVTTDLEKLQRPVSSWQALMEGLEEPQGMSDALQPLGTRLSRLSAHGQDPGQIAYVVPMPPVDSSFVLALSKGPSSLDDPIIPALMVATAYLNVVEGSLWTALRGTGLAYGSSFSRHVDSGQVSLDIYSSPNPLNAFFAARDAVTRLVNGDSSFETLTLDGAKSSIVLSFAHAEATKASAAESSFVRQVIRGLPKEWPSLILERVRGVTVEEIRKAMKDILLPIFNAKTSNLFITCAPIMEKDVMTRLSGAGFEPVSRSLASFQDDYGIGEGIDEDGQSNEDDESDEDDSESENGEEAEGNDSDET